MEQGDHNEKHSVQFCFISVLNQWRINVATTLIATKPNVLMAIHRRAIITGIDLPEKDPTALVANSISSIHCIVLFVSTRNYLV